MSSLKLGPGKKSDNMYKEKTFKCFNSEFLLELISALYNISTKPV